MPLTQGIYYCAIRDNSAESFGLKTTWGTHPVGGLSAMRTIRDLCHAHSLPHTCDDAWGGDIIAAACLHIGATVSPNLCEGVWIAAPYIDHHYDPENSITVKDGWLNLPTTPGLGVLPKTNLFGSSVQSYG